MQKRRRVWKREGGEGGRQRDTRGVNRIYSSFVASTKSHPMVRFTIFSPPFLPVHVSLLLYSPDRAVSFGDFYSPMVDDPSCNDTPRRATGRRFEIPFLEVSLGQSSCRPEGTESNVARMFPSIINTAAPDRASRKELISPFMAGPVFRLPRCLFAMNYTILATTCCPVFAR